MSVVVNIDEVSDDALNLKNMMDGIIERVQRVYQINNVPLPPRQYWTMGLPTIDTEQVVVTFNQMYLGSPGDQATFPVRGNQPRTVTITISIARAFVSVGVNGRPPSAEKIQQSSSLAAIDAWVLMESVKYFDMWEDTGIGYGPGVIATLEAPEPAGGFQVVNLQLTMVVP